MPRAFWALALMCLLLACGIPGIALNEQPTPNRTIAPVPTALAPATLVATRVVNVPPPTWWAKEIEMPKGAELTSNNKRVATWQTQDADVDTLRDFFKRIGESAGYRVFILTKSAGAIYDMLFVKSPNVYALNLTRGASVTTFTANLGALMHIKTTGATNIEVDLPIKELIPMTPGGEVFIGTEMPGPCGGCLYTTFIHIAPFKGVGAYTAKPAGIYVIDVLVVPGADPLKEDYRWADNCAVAIPDAMHGQFTCGNLSNIYEPTKKINVTGSWVQPPPP